MYPQQQRGRQRSAGGGEAGDETVPGGCDCSGFPPLDDIKDLPILRLLKRLEDELETYQDVPSDATKKLADDLKSFTKEYGGLTDLVTKYTAFYDKVDCLLADANRWKTELREWCSNNVDENVAASIVTLWNDSYEAIENEQCARWIAARTDYGAQLDCLRQAERAADEAKEDYEAIKGFEKAVNDRQTQLQGLFKQGLALNTAGQFNSVCAISLEFCAAFNELGTVDSWDRRRRCGSAPETQQQSAGRQGQGGYGGGTGDGEQPAGSPCDATPEQNLKDWNADRYRLELTTRLRHYILARYSYFRWWQQRLQLEVDMKRAKEALDRFQKARQADFIREAADAAVNERSVVNA
jgi:hypothetical protein